MASNNGLKKEITDLASDLKLDNISTDGLNNKKLTDLLSDLKAKKRDAELETQADTPESTDDSETNDSGTEETDSTADGELCYCLADGKSVTSKRGIIGEGDEIKPGDLAGGQEAFDKFVTSGHFIVKK